MAQLNLVQAGFLNPILDALKDTGANLNPLLMSSGLNKFNLNNAENYVPVNAMYTLFDELNRREGIDDFLAQFSEEINLVSLSQWGEMIAYTPDLLTAIQMAVRHDGVVMSHEQAGFEINGKKTLYWQRFTDQHVKGREQADFLSFALAIKAVQLAAGKNWAPLEIHLQSHIAPNLDTILPSGNNTKIFLGQAATAIVFPTSMLAMPMLGKDSNCELTTEFQTLTNLSSKIDSLLTSLLPELVHNIKHIAEITGSSTRTLQRNLTEEGTSLSELVDQWRFKKALQLLENPRIMVKDISEQLGYANVPNFVRAFKRWTNTSPNSYRDLL